MSVRACRQLPRYVYREVRVSADSADVQGTRVAQRGQAWCGSLLTHYTERTRVLEYKRDCIDRVCNCVEIDRLPQIDAYAEMHARSSLRLLTDQSRCCGTGSVRCTDVRERRGVEEQIERVFSSLHASTTFLLPTVRSVSLQAPCHSPLSSSFLLVSAFALFI